MGLDPQGQSGLDSALLALSYYDAVRTQNLDLKRALEAEYDATTLLASGYGLVSMMLHFNVLDEMVANPTSNEDWMARSVADIRAKLLDLGQAASELD